MEIKICGITNLADARYAAAAGATHLGFVLHESSPRYIDPDSAEEIIEWVFGAKSVGVFVDRTADEINCAVETAGFDAVQLHGKETPETCRAVDSPVIKAFRVKAGSPVERVRSTMREYSESVDYFLLDAFSADCHGGTGTVVDWKLAAVLAEEFPIFLAGGITPDNAAEASRIVRPAGLDLSSGLEQSPGKKSFEMIDEFFEALKSQTRPGVSA